MTPAKILAVDDEPDFELLLKQRFRRQLREQEFVFRFARHGEEALVALAAEPDIVKSAGVRHRPAAKRGSFYSIGSRVII